MQIDMFKDILNDFTELEKLTKEDDHIEDRARDKIKSESMKQELDKMRSKLSFIKEINVSRQFNKLESSP